MAKETASERFGREIRRRREELGLTQDELADRSGLTSGYIGTIELGRRDPSLSVLEKLSIALDATVSELFGPPLEMSKKAFEMGRLLEDAPPKVQEAILVILRQAGPGLRK